MQVNLPILDRLHGCKSLLLTGIGGGYDIFCGLPLYFDLRERGFNVHLANYSFSNVTGHAHGTRLSDTLVGVRADHEGIYPYFPEYFLAQWLARTTGQDIPVWSFQKTGTRPLAADYALLASHLQLDSVLMIDGGVDSLMRGDESETGTLVEDAISMAAVRSLSDLKVRLLTCIGFGAERDMTYAHVFENIAALTREGAFLGTCSLTPRMGASALYEQAVLYVQGQTFQDPSVINSSIVSALRGEFGDFHLTPKTRGSQLWISPLMPMYWFFEFDAVARRSLVLDIVEHSNTFREALMDVVHHIGGIPRRTPTIVPL